MDGGSTSSPAGPTWCQAHLWSDKGPSRPPRYVVQTPKKRLVDEKGIWVLVLPVSHTNSGTSLSNPSLCLLIFQTGMTSWYCFPHRMVGFKLANECKSALRNIQRILLIYCIFLLNPWTASLGEVGTAREALWKWSEVYRFLAFPGSDRERRVWYTR